MANVSGHNYADDLLNSPAESTPEPVSATKHDYADDILSGGSETVGGNVTVTNRPFVRNDPEMAAGGGDLAVASFADDPMVRMKYLAEQRFPDDPNAIQRYGFDSDSGQIFYQADDGKLYSEDQPEGGVGQFLKRNVAGGASKAIPFTAQTVAGVATAPALASGPLGAAGSVAAVGAAGAGGESIRQFIGKRMLGDKFNTGEVIKETILPMVGQGVGGLAMKFGNRFVARDLARIDPTKAAQLGDDAARVGIDLTPAEQTGLRSLQQQQRVVARTPEGADVMGDFYTRRNTEQIPRAVDDVLNRISPVAETDVAAQNLKAASGEIGEAAIKARSDAVRPIYQKLMTPDNVVDASNFADDAVYKSVLDKVRKDPIFGGLKDAPDNSLPMIDAVKKEFDDMIGAATQAGQRNRARVLAESRDKMLSVADDAFPEYAQVRSEFAGMSPEVTQVTKGPIGVNAKSGGQVKDTGALFDFNRLGPGEIRKARATFEKAGKMDEYNAGLRAFIQNKWSQATKDTAAGPKANLAGAYRASIFGDVRAREAMKAAMAPDQYDAFTRLMDVLEAAGKAMPEGSPTATDMAGMKTLSAEAGGLMNKTGRLLTKPLSTINEWLEAGASSSHAENIAQIITSKEGMAKLRELRKLSPTSEKARVIVAQLLTNEVAKTPKRVFGYGKALKPGDVTAEDMANLSYLTSGQPASRQGGK